MKNTWILFGVFAAGFLIGGFTLWTQIGFVRNVANENVVLPESLIPQVSTGGSPMKCWQIQWCPSSDWRYTDPREVCDYGWEYEERHGIKFTTENIKDLYGASSRGEYCEIIK